MAQPFLKWAGGKRQLLPELRKYVPFKFHTYYEPFVGGGALFFDLQPARATLNDMNAELVGTYCALKTGVEKVIKALRKHRYNKTHYYRVRSDVSVLGLHDAAARMIFLNRAGFNGLYRVNSRGEFNVPFGRYTNPTICDAENLRACAKVLKDAQILSVDFESAVSRAKQGDFVYFDPPYVPASATSDFTRYTKNEFGPTEQVRLRDLALRLGSRGVHVLLSNSDTPCTRELYTRRGFHVESVEARRNINSKVGKRGPVGELIIHT